MSGREEFGWIAGTILTGLALLIGGLGYVEIKSTTIRAEAWVESANVIGNSLVGTVEAWQD